MKYYFTRDCYWDEEEKKVFRKNEEVHLTPYQTKILSKLLKENGTIVSHEALYFAMTGKDPKDSSDDWKSSLSNQFTRNKPSNKGILIKVPEIKSFYEHNKSPFDGGGYKICVPEDNIRDESFNEILLNKVDSKIWMFGTYLRKQKEKSTKMDADRISKTIESYLKGDQCSWPLIFSSIQYSPVKRDVINEVIKAIDERKSAITITGAGGEGKTTILKQLCAELFNSGKTVFYHCDTYKFDISDDIPDGIFLVDNPPNSTGFKEFLSKAVIEGNIVVMTTRSNEWSALKPNLTAEIRRSVKEIEIPKISNREAKAFAEYISTFITGIERSMDELEVLFLKESYGFLYASMLLAVYNADSLENIALEIIDNISNFNYGKNSLKILASIVFAEQSGISITNKTFKSLCENYSLNNTEVKEHLKKEVSLNGGRWQTRHESISNLFYRFLFTDGDWKEYLDEDEREKVIIDILDIYLEKVSNSNKEISPKDDYVKETTALLLQAFKTIGNEESQDYIIQRLFESCQQYGFSIIYTFYFHFQNSTVRRKLAELCFEHQLPLFQLYDNWIKELLSDDEQKEEAVRYLKVLCIDMNARSNIWVTWAQYEIKSKNYGDTDTEYSARWIFKEGCNKFSNASVLWLKWGELEINDKNYGTPDTEYSARWIFKEGCNKCSNASALWLKWGELEINDKNYGTPDTKYSTRWIFKEGCNKCSNVYSLWLKWGELEIDDKNYGTPDTEYSARWIFKEGCNKCSNASVLWLKWGELEINDKNYGTPDTEYSARWIFKEGCSKCSTASSLWLKWGELEIKDNNYGTADTEYSARWIYHQGCQKNIKDPQIWLHWGNVEAELEERSEKYGDTDTQYSARWIFNEGLKYCANDPQLWLHWGDLEVARENYGDIDTMYSACWIFNEGCKHCTDDPQLWLHWGDLEVARENYGDIDTEYSARWIFNKGCKHCTNDPQIWLHWGKLEIARENYGDIDTEYSARWIFDKGLKHCTNDPQLWLHWGELEISRENYGDIDTEYSARWIFKEGCNNCDNDDPQLRTHWANLEEKIGNAGDYDKVNSAAWLHKEICMNDNNRDEGAWTRWLAFIGRNKLAPDISLDNDPCTVLKKECLSGTVSYMPWIAWAFFEEIKENIGDYSTEYSASWLYRESCVNHNFNNSIYCWLRWARFAYKYPLKDNDDELVDVNYVLCKIEKLCTHLNEQEKLELDTFKKEVLN